MPVVNKVSTFKVVNASGLYNHAVATTDRISELESEVKNLKGILQKISDKLQDNGEFDNELRRLLFSV